MGNPSLHFPGDKPTSCWDCAKFLGLHTYTRPGVGKNVVFLSVICAERGQGMKFDPDTSCRRWEPQKEKSPKPQGPGE